MNILEEYDRERLQEARNIVLKIYEYYYGSNGNYRLSNRLCTILNKMDELLEMEKQNL